MTQELFPSLASLAASGFVFRIQDNGGASADRYTVAFCDGDYLALSATPDSAQGVSLWGERIDVQAMAERVEEGAAVDLALGDLSPAIAEHVRQRLNDGFADFLAAIEAGAPHACAPSRDSAEENQGLYSDGGVGIYQAPDGLRIRADGAEPANDLGPYATARDALAASLPADYSLSGPEFFSGEEVARLEPSEAVAERVANLESRVRAADDAESAEYVARMRARFPT